MSPTIYCVRHAQGVHNLSVKNHQILDPSLTRHGEEQCRHLARVFPYHHKIDMLCSSPLVRCIQTTMFAFDKEIRSGMDIIALPDAQETANIACDTGKDPEELRRIMKNKPVDLALVEPGWNAKQGRYSPEPEAIVERARELRRWLRSRPETNIVLVTHGGFLHWLTEDWDATQKAPGQTGWANAEFRSYQFDDDDENATMVETRESKKLRFGTEKPLSDSEQLELQLTAPRKARLNGNLSMKPKSVSDRDWIGGFC